jgi:hypothetical protein
MNSSAQPFLSAQFDLYVTQTQAAESIAARPQAMDYRDVEDAISLGLAILASLRRYSESWAVEVAAGREAFSWETSRRFSDQYRWWKDHTTALLKAVDSCKAQGSAVAGEAEIRSAFKDVSLMALDTERVRESFEDGGDLSHPEAMDELRRRLATRRT